MEKGRAPALSEAGNSESAVAYIYCVKIMFCPKVDRFSNFSEEMSGLDLEANSPDFLTVGISAHWLRRAARL